MIQKLVSVIQENYKEILQGFFVGGGSYSILLTNINMGMKLLVTAATLVFFIIKIYKELKK